MVAAGRLNLVGQSPARMVAAGRLNLVAAGGGNMKVEVPGSEVTRSPRAPAAVSADRQLDLSFQRVLDSQTAVQGASSFVLLSQVPLTSGIVLLAAAVSLLSVRRFRQRSESAW